MAQLIWPRRCKHNFNAIWLYDLSSLSIVPRDWNATSAASVQISIKRNDSYQITSKTKPNMFLCLNLFQSAWTGRLTFFLEIHLNILSTLSFFFCWWETEKASNFSCDDCSRMCFSDYSASLFEMSKCYWTWLGFLIGNEAANSLYV